MTELTSVSIPYLQATFLFVTTVVAGSTHLEANWTCEISSEGIMPTTLEHHLKMHT